MSFNYSVSLSDPAAAFDAAQDSFLTEALDNALNVWGQYIGSGGLLKVQLNVRDLGPAGSNGLIALASAAPSSYTAIGRAPNGQSFSQAAATTDLRQGMSVAANDIQINFNSELLPSLGINTSYDIVKVFEHELMHGFGVIGNRDAASFLAGIPQTIFDVLSNFGGTGNGFSDVFTGAAAEYVYGGPVPLTTGLGTGSNYYHVGATGTAADPAALRADLIYPISTPGQSITALDVAMLEDIGIPLSAAGSALIDPNPSTSIGSRAAVQGPTVTDPVIGGITQPGEQVTILSGSTVLGTTNANGTGAWAFRATNLADGPVTLTASLQGANGAVLTSTSFTLDTLNPLNKAFLDVVGRPLDAASLPGLRANLLAGGSVTTLRDVLATSVEGSRALYNLWVAVVGRAITQQELPVAQQAVGNGASLASLRGVLANSAEAATAVANTFQAVVGRGLAAGEQQGAANALANGASLASLRSVLSTSAEAAAKITALFGDTVGRAPTATELPAVERALAGGASLAGLRVTLGTSAEEGTALTGLFNAVLGRAPTAAELPAAEQAIANGASLGSLRAVLSTSTEEGNAVSAAYQSVLGRIPSPTEIQAVEAGISGGTSLATAKAALVNSVEAANDVNAAFQSALGRPANAVEVAADRSELQSGISLTLVRAGIAQLAGGPAPQPAGAPTIAITPATLGGAGPSLVYGLLNNDALIAGAAESVTDQFVGASGQAVITGFNPAVDVFQIESKQAASFAQLTLTGLNATDTAIGLPGGATFLLHGTPQTVLTAANFHFV